VRVIVLPAGDMIDDPPAAADAVVAAQAGGT
jgi:hypothetical protein